MMPAAGGLTQILNIRKLARLRRVLKIGRKLTELIGLCRVPIGLRRLGSILKIRRDLRCHLLILRRILLLELLETAKQLSQR